MKEVSERDWLVAVRKKISLRQTIDPMEIKFSPSHQLAAFVRGPAPPPDPKVAASASHGQDEKLGVQQAAKKTSKTEEKKGAKASEKRAAKKPAAKAKKPPPRRYQIVVVDTEGKTQSSFRPVTAAGSDEPPKDFRFLSDAAVIYEVVAPPPDPAAKPAHKKPEKKSRNAAKTAEKANTKAKGAGVPAAPPLPRRLFMIHPLAKRARPIRCEGTRFSWSPQHEHIAFVQGTDAKNAVNVDGVQTYPRKGKTTIASEPKWSKDALSLAFLEVRTPSPPRLVLLAEFDNPTGDTTWDLPVTAPTDGAEVFWAGAGKLVVGRSALKPIFSTRFEKEKPVKFDP